MNTRSSHFKASLIVLGVVVLVSGQTITVRAQQRRPAFGRNLAIVVDERLSVLRATPSLSGKLLRRIGRGKSVGIRRGSHSRDGIEFYRVTVTRRTSGWVQREALISPWRKGDDERLLRLIEGSEDFDLISRARIFLDVFPASRLRPKILLLFGLAAEQAAAKLSRDALRRLNPEEMKASSAPTHSYFLNYSGLDRYNRQGIRFVFDPATMKFRYNGASWSEILRRYPHSSEAVEARKQLAALHSHLLNRAGH